MSFGSRIIERRKELGISQTELGLRTDIHKNVMGKYERDEVKPSIEIAHRIAMALQTSLDYLMGTINISIQPDMLKKIEELQKLDRETQKYILYTFEALLRDAKARQAYS